MAFLKSIWKNNSKHQKLSDAETSEGKMVSKKNEKNEKNKEVLIADEATENDHEDVTFKLKYLGSTVVEKVTGESISTEAVKNILKTAKAARKKLQRVSLTVSLKGITVTDLKGNDVFKISMYRISNCSTDPTHKQIFSFISTDEHETMECHAFLCSKRKIAETVTLTVGHAFSSAYEAWKIIPPQQHQTISKENQSNNVGNDTFENDSCKVIEVKLIDFDDEPCAEDDDIFDLIKPPCENNINADWVCFEDDFVSETSKVPQRANFVFA